MEQRRMKTISIILTILLISTPLVGFTTPEVQSSPKKSDFLSSKIANKRNVGASARDEREWTSSSKSFLSEEDDGRSMTYPSQKVSNQFLLLFPNRGAMKTFSSQTDMSVLHQYSLLPLLLVEGSKEEIQTVKKEVNSPIRAYPNRKHSLLSENTTSSSVRPKSGGSVSAIGADSFWSEGFKGENVSIAIIDTGVSHHQELRNRITNEASFVNETYGYNTNVDPTENVRDHATAVAGIAAGAGEYNSKGQGVAPKASIINARVFGPPGSQEDATSAAIIAAIEWSVKVEADVINLSLGTPYPIWYQDPEILLVNKAMRQGTTVVIAAGNEGSYGIRTMSVGSPGYAHEAITVGATSSNAENPAIPYTSIGPGTSSNVKPDLSAPGNVYHCIPDNGYSDRIGRGTSFATPHIAGAAALIYEYIHDKKSNVPKGNYPGVVKSLLMNTTSPMKEENKYGEIWAGTGVVNLSTAGDKLETSPTTSQEVPKILSITPSYLPMGIQQDKKSFYPYADTLFHNQSLAFNFTLASSYNTTASINFTGNLTDALTLHSGSSFEITTPTTLWEFKFTVENAGTATPGYYCGEIVFDIGSDQYEVPMAFELETPRASLLWDMQHTSWLQDYKYGQYSKLYQYLTENNVAVSTWRYGSTLESTQLLDPSKYDIVYVPDAASFYPNYASNDTIQSQGTTGFTSQEINDFTSYVNNGGIVLLSGMNSQSNNFTALNELTKKFGIEYNNASSTDTVPASITEQADTHLLTWGVQKLAYQGCNMTLSEGVLPVARYQGRNVMALNETGEGAFIATSTNFMFDDWNFAGEYPSGTKESTENLVKNIILLSKRQEEQAPYVRITSLSPGDVSCTGKNVTVQWEGGDTDFHYFAIKTNESSSWTNVSKRTTHTFTNLQSGATYTVYVNATDYQGLSNTTSISFTVDATNPQVNIKSPSQGTTSPNITLQWDGSDNLGINYYEVWNGSTWTSVGKKTQCKITGLNGSVTLKVKAIDLAGLDDIAETSFTADGSGPKVSITSPKEGTTIKQKQVKIEWSANDSVSELRNYSKIQIDNGDWKKVNKSSFTTSLSEGAHSVKVRVWDKFGNYNTAKVSFTVSLEQNEVYFWTMVGTGVGIIIAVSAGIIFLVRKRGKTGE